MSDIQIEVTRILAVNPHPGADRLEIATILGTECVVPKDKFVGGELVLWFPPNLLIPEAVAEKLGVVNYLKHGDYPGTTVKSKCRVAACRLRGTPSYGFIVSVAEASPAAAVYLKSQPVAEYVAAEAARGIDVQCGGAGYEYDPKFPDTVNLSSLKEGDNLDDVFGAVKYTPPAVREPGLPRPKGFNGDAAPDNENFHKYTDIQNYYKYAPAFEEGMDVRITEKLHGSNIRLGLVKSGDEFEFLCGSHKVNWKEEDAKGNTPIWWRMLSERVMNLLSDLCNVEHSVIIFGELVGPGVQDMDYGIDEDCAVRVFDISIDGRYMDWDELTLACDMHGIKTVPLLYYGPFSPEILKEHTNGPTVLAAPEQIKAKFKGREGCVVTPTKEQFSRYIGGRLILKSVSADYHDRKGGLDLG